MFPALIEFTEATSRPCRPEPKLNCWAPPSEGGGFFKTEEWRFPEELGFPL